MYVLGIYNDLFLQFQFMRKLFFLWFPKYVDLLYSDQFFFSSLVIIFDVFGGIAGMKIAQI